MITIKLANGVKFYEDEDSNFFLYPNESSDVDESIIKNPDIKFGFLQGKLILAEGELLFKYKTALIYVPTFKNDNVIYLFEDDKFFLKSFKDDTTKEVKPNKILYEKFKIEVPKNDTKIK